MIVSIKVVSLPPPSLCPRDGCSGRLLFHPVHRRDFGTDAVLVSLESSSARSVALVLEAVGLPSLFVRCMYRVVVPVDKVCFSALLADFSDASPPSFRSRCFLRSDEEVNGGVLGLLFPLPLSSRVSSPDVHEDEELRTVGLLLRAESRDLSNEAENTIRVGWARAGLLLLPLVLGGKVADEDGAAGGNGLLDGATQWPLPVQEVEPSRSRAVMAVACPVGTWRLFRLEEGANIPFELLAVTGGI